MLMIGLLILSFAISNHRPGLAALLDITLVVIILLFRIIPGNAGFLEWIIMALLLITTGYLFVAAGMTGEKRTLRTYIRSIRATFFNHDRSV
jgi:hypothetical protein